MVTLGSLGTQSYFLNWLLAVAAIKFIATLTWQFCNWTLRIVGNFVPHFGEGWKMARSWLLLSPSVLSRKGWKVVWQEVITPHASSLWSVDSFVAHFHKRDLCSQLSAELELLSSALLCWYDGGRRQDVRYEPSLLPADSVRCGQGQDSPQQRSLQQHNCGAERERATH